MKSHYELRLMGKYQRDGAPDPLEALRAAYRDGPPADRVEDAPAPSGDRGKAGEVSNDR